MKPQNAVQRHEDDKPAQNDDVIAGEQRRTVVSRIARRLNWPRRDRHFLLPWKENGHGLFASSFLGVLRPSRGERFVFTESFCEFRDGSRAPENFFDTQAHA